uniref:Uncharacterized protein n=1 Tax=Octopus bimaculoides TaxID=37653 RepID=A0A0L8FIE2_OCTBM
MLLVLTVPAHLPHIKATLSVNLPAIPLHLLSIHSLHLVQQIELHPTPLLHSDRAIYLMERESYLLSC